MANQVVQLPVIQWEEPKPKYTPKTTAVAVAKPSNQGIGAIGWFTLLAWITVFFAVPGFRYMQQNVPQTAPYTQSR